VPKEGKEGEFFNDATGKRGKELEDVVEGLHDLSMRTGALATIMDETSWGKLGKELKKKFKDKAKENNYVAHLGVIEVGKGDAWEWNLIYPDGEKVETDEVKQIVKSLMEANGQMAYIRRQEWFTGGKSKIEIDVNYYPARPLTDTSALAFHKDTGGNNIFVNLLFNNDEEIPATEWFVDVAEPSAQRKNWQLKWLPEGHLKEVAKARAELQGAEEKKGAQKNLVRGGVVGKNAYASWIDDLIWHSTPQMSKRKTTTVEEIISKYDKLPEENYPSPDLKISVPEEWREILLIIAENPETQLAVLLKEEHKTAQDLGEQAVARSMWWYLYSKGNREIQGKAFLEADVGKVDWAKVRLGSLVGEAIAQDTRLSQDATSISELTGLESLERENEVDATLAKVKKAHEESTKKGETRSFIRTWVRIVPAV
jgi:hypothetical protein